jgi:single-strand DNA-binding protein
MRDVNSLNKVILIGHVGQDPELRYIPQTETPVANFSLATNERIFNPSTSESDTRTEWHRIVAWRKLAEFCDKFLTKGKQIMVEGRIRTEKWQDRDGNTRYTTKIHASNITLLGKREGREEEERSDYESAPAEFPSEESSLPDITKQEDDEDVPF